MPISESLQRAVDVGRVPELAAAFEVMGFLTPLDLLTYQSSFMAEDTLEVAELSCLASDIRRTRDAHTGPHALCGGLTSFPADAAALPILRRILYTARVENELDKKTLTAPAASPVEEGKPLPAAELNNIWQEGAAVTGGFCSVLPRFRLSDAIISRMARSNRRGEMWIPPLDHKFSYKDTAANHSIVTLLKSDPSSGNGPDMEIQLVQSPLAAERRDHVRLVADYLDVITHRSAALVACYSTPAAGASYRACPGFKSRTPHISIQKGQEVILSAQMVSKLERSLRAATRNGLSTADVVRVDQAVIAAIMTRMADVACDGNSAVEFVCDQQPTLFSPCSVSIISVADVSSLSHSVPSDARTVYPHDSISNAGSSASSSHNKRSAADERLIARLQSERDHAVNASKKIKSEDRAHGKEGVITYGGNKGRSGGGDSRANAICKLYNLPEGCFRNKCHFRHACSKSINGRTCGVFGHNACTH